MPTAYKYTISLTLVLVSLLWALAAPGKPAQAERKSESTKEAVVIATRPNEPAYQKVSEFSLLTSEIQLVKPADVVVDNDGSIYLTDMGSRAVLKISPEGKLLWIRQETQDKRIAFPVKIAYDGLSTLFVGELYEGTIHIFKTDGTYVKSLGERGDEPGKFAQLGGLCISPLGDIFVAALARDKILRFKSDGTFIREFGESGDKDGEIFAPTGLVCDSEGKLIVIDLNDRIQLFGSDGTFISKWGGMGDETGQLKDPRGLAIDANGLVYIADTGNQRIQRLSLTHTDVNSVLRPDLTWGDSPADLREPTGIAVMSDGTVVVADPKAGKITVWRQPQTTPTPK